MRVVFIGTGEIGVPTLRALQNSEHALAAVFTQPDKPAGRHQRLEPPPIKIAATGFGLPVFQPSRIKHEAAIDQLRALRPDAVVVMAYGQILPRQVLELPPLACLNLHASLLPRWRGAAPIQAAIAAGDHETGITVMYMSEGLDTGDILSQRKTPLADADTGGMVHDRLAQLAPDALLQALLQLEAGNAPRSAQDNGQATYAPKLTRDSGKIEWLEPAETSERKIRAYDPWPGSYTYLSGKVGRVRLKVFRATVTNETAAPGMIVRADENGVVIGTATTALCLVDVQLEGKRRMPAGEFIRGFDLESASCR